MKITHQHTTDKKQAKASTFFSPVIVQSKLFIGKNTIQRQGGGPYHPPEGTDLRCRRGDTCPQISLKINYLRHTIRRHIEWDQANPNPSYPDGRHAEEIADLQRALARCIQEAARCRRQPEYRPVSQEQPQEAERRVRDTIPSWLLALLGAVATAALVACFATGVCELGIVIGGLGAAAAAALLFILVKSGVISQEQADQYA